MGIEPFWIASSLLCVISQRLVRKVHEECCEDASVSKEMLVKFPPTDQTLFKHGKGCSACQGTGYLGRMALFEMLVLSSEIESMIVTNAYTVDIHAAAQRSGMASLTQEGFDKALEGLTTVEEVMRIAPPVENSFILEKNGPVRPTEIAENLAPPPQGVPMEQKEPVGLQDCVLVIDDDEAIQRFVKRVLTQEFYFVKVAGNAREGLKQVFMTPPDLILVDYDMPEINGIEFIQKLKTHSRMANIPVIMLTATQAEETEVKALTVGADDWISKPIVKERLLARIKRLLNK